MGKKIKKKDIKYILGIIAFTILLTYFVNNVSIVSNIGKVLYPFILGGGLAFVLNIPLNIIERKIINRKNKTYKTKFVRILSIIISIMLIILIIVAINYLFIPDLINSIDTLIQKVPDTIENVKNIVLDLTKEYPQIKDTIQSNISENQQDISNKLQGLLSNALSGSVNLISSFFSKTVDCIVAIVFAFYILINKEQLLKQLRKIVIAYFSKPKGKEIFRVLEISNNTFNNFVTGQCKEAVILGVLCCIGMLILRIPYAKTIGLITMITALIPIIGAWFSGIFGFLLIVTVDPMKAIVFAIFIIILQQLEGNFIYPKVVGNVIQLPSMWVLVAITIGGKLCGIAGILLGVPILSIIYTIFTQEVNTRIKAKHTKKVDSIDSI